MGLLYEKRQEMVHIAYSEDTRRIIEILYYRKICV